MAIKEKGLPFFTPEEELEEDGSGETFGGGEDQDGDVQPDFFTWLEKTSGYQPDPGRGTDQFDTPKADGERLRAGIPEGGDSGDEDASGDSCNPR